MEDTETTQAPSPPKTPWQLGVASRKRKAAFSHRVIADKLESEAEALEEQAAAAG